MNSLVATPPTPCPTITRAEFQVSSVELQNIGSSENLQDNGSLEGSSFNANAEKKYSRNSQETWKQPEPSKPLKSSGRKGHERSLSESGRTSRPLSRLSITSKSSTNSKTSSRAVETKVCTQKPATDPFKRRSIPPITTRPRRESTETARTTTPNVNKLRIRPSEGCTMVTAFKSPAINTRTPATSARPNATTPVNIKGSSRPVTPAASIQLNTTTPVDIKGGSRPVTPAMRSPTLTRNSLSSRTPKISRSVTAETPIKRGTLSSATLSSSAKSRVISFDKNSTSLTTIKGDSAGLSKLTTELAEMKQKSEKACQLLAKKEKLLQKREAELQDLRAKLSEVNTILATEQPYETSVNPAKLHELENQYNHKLALLRKDFTKELEKVKSDHEIELNLLRTGKESEIDCLIRREAETIATKENDVNFLTQQILDLKSELVSLRDEHQSLLNSLSKQYQDQIQELEESYQADIELLRQNCNHEHKDRLQETQRELQTMQQRFEVELSSLIDLHTQELEALKVNHEEKVCSVKTHYEESIQTYEKEIERLKSHYTKEFQQLEIQSNHRNSKLFRELEESRASHNLEMEMLSATHKTELEKLQSEIGLLRTGHTHHLERIQLEHEQTLRSLLALNEDLILQNRSSVEKLEDVKVVHDKEMGILLESHASKIQNLVQELHAIKHQKAQNETRSKHELTSIEAKHIDEILLLHNQHSTDMSTFHEEQKTALNTMQSENNQLLGQYQLNVSEMATIEHEVLCLNEKLMTVNAEHAEEIKALRDQFEQEVTRLQLQNEALAEKVQLNDTAMVSLKVAHEEELRDLKKSHAMEIASLEKTTVHAGMEVPNTLKELKYGLEEIASLNAEIPSLRPQHLLKMKEHEEYIEEVECSHQEKIDESVESALKDLQVKYEQELEEIQDDHSLELHNSKIIMKDYVDEITELNQAKQDLNTLRQVAFLPREGIEIRHAANMEKSSIVIKAKSYAKSEEPKELSLTISQMENGRTALQNEAEVISDTMKDPSRQYADEYTKARSERFTKLPSKEDQQSTSQNLTTAVKQNLKNQLPISYRALEEESVNCVTIRNQLDAYAEIEKMSIPVNDTIQKITANYMDQLSGKDQDTAFMEQSVNHLDDSRMQEPEHLEHQYDSGQFNSEASEREIEESELLTGSEGNNVDTGDGILEVDSLFQFELITLL